MQLSATSSNMPREFQDIVTIPHSHYKIRNCIKTKNLLREEIEKNKYQAAEKLLFSDARINNQMN
jgi:exopolysaccharide biosynthesis protein